jgi:hypothetical protein
VVSERIIVGNSVMRAIRRKPTVRSQLTANKIRFVPPEAKSIDRFARDVCHQLVQNGDSAFSDPDVVSGFADFLSFIAEVVAKHLNQGHDEFLDEKYK